MVINDNEDHESNFIKDYREINNCQKWKNVIIWLYKVHVLWLVVLTPQVWSELDENVFLMKFKWEW